MIKNDGGMKVRIKMDVSVFWSDRDFGLGHFV